MAYGLTSYEANGHEFALGLDWRVISSKKEIGSLARESDTAYGVVRLLESTTGEEPSYRLGLAGADAKGQISGAAALAATVSNVLLVQPISENRYWLVFVTRGQVMPRTDYVGTLEQVKQRMIDVLSSHSAAEEGLQLCAPGIRRDADFEKFSDTNFERLIKEYVPSNKERVGRVVSPISPKQMALLGVAVVALFIVAKLWHGHHAQQLKQEVAVVIHQAPPVHLNRQQQFEKLAVVASSDLTGHAPTTVARYFRETLQRYWPSADGWQLTSMNVTAGVGATLQFSNQNHLTVLAFKHFIGDAGSVSFSSDGDTATVSIPWKAHVGNSDSAALATSLESAKDVSLQLASDLQAASITYSLSPGPLPLPKTGTSPQAALGLAPDQPIPVERYAVSASVPLWNLRHMAHVMEQYPTMGVSQLAIDLNSSTDQTVALTGVLYEAH